MKPNFTLLIQMYQMEGFVALGKVKNPVTDELSRSQEHASWIIDLLAILQEKTQGNLEASESRLLDETLNTLRLNFVEEFGNASAPSSSGNLA
ncbi:MAG: DUF1844 domain-containing protein [Ignavibacteria bacterium]|nr:DUF1844 domain-containing protein [Ignavibacteria bacterium]